MKVELKSDQYYDFYNIRKIWVSEDRIEIEGSFGKNKRYKKIVLLPKMIDERCLKELKRYMKNYMNRFDFEGKCPYCESEQIWVIQKQTHVKEINNPKPRQQLLDRQDIKCECKMCKKHFDTEQMMYSDKILYWR